jgi:acetoacetyl-CoA reductase/3-oxoacyl-[acyl-carrier protein] reductase
MEEREIMGALEGKVALVTGASRGIGKAIALELAREGAMVALNYRNGEAQAREVAEQIVAMAAATLHGEKGKSTEHAGVASTGSVATTLQAPEVVMLAQADVSNAEEAKSLVGRVVEKWGRLDILVNNAGITRDRTLRKLSADDWMAVIETNLNSAYFCTSAAIPTMIEQKYGRIVSISSVIGQSGNIGQANYAAAKAGMIAFTKSVALELARYNITANTVCPGFTATEMVMAVPENIQDQIKAKIPLGRFAETEEIAKAVRFLVVDGAYITGHQLNVNGGIYM